MACGVGVVAGAPADEPADKTIVRLPPYFVEAKLPIPWRYAKVQGLEVLSAVDDSSTEEFIRRFHRLDELLSAVVPERLRARFSVPEVQILYDEKLPFVRARDILTGLIEERKRQAKAKARASPDGAAAELPAEVRFLPNLRFSDVDVLTGIVDLEPPPVVGGGHYLGGGARGTGARPVELRFGLDPDRVYFLLHRRQPVLPEWFVTGVMELLAGATYQDTWIDLPALIWISEDATQKLVKQQEEQRAMVTPDELFAYRPAPEAGKDDAWRAQCALFVRWALATDDARRREGLWTLIERLEKEPLSEALFRECLGQGFIENQRALQKYLPVAAKKAVRLRADNLTELPAFEVREATGREIARLRGDWERMAVNYVKVAMPELTAKYAEQARNTLRRTSTGEGEGDPTLLALLGLLEADAGHAPEARRLLEAAASQGMDRPRACVELARLRYEDALRGAAGAKFTPRQVSEILAPLAAARQQEPAISVADGIEVETWSHAAAPPSGGALAQLNESVARFPDQSLLLLRTIQLDVLNGVVEPARELAERGRRHARDPEVEQRFTRVQKELAQLGKPAARP